MFIETISAVKSMYDFCQTSWLNLTTLSISEALIYDSMSLFVRCICPYCTSKIPNLHQTWMYLSLFKTIYMHFCDIVHQYRLPHGMKYDDSLLKLEFLMCLISTFMYLWNAWITPPFSILSDISANVHNTWNQC